MIHKKSSLKIKIWSLALCVSMVLSSVPVSVFAETQETYKYECEEEHSEEVTAGSTEEKSS